jgi:hypothetical protein
VTALSRLDEPILILTARFIKEPPAKFAWESIHPTNLSGNGAVLS